MSKLRISFRIAVVVSLLTAVLLTSLVPSHVMAVPQIPMQLYGNVVIGGSPAPDGIEIDARIGGISYKTATTVGGQYGYYDEYGETSLFLVPADDPDTPAKEGGIEGENVMLYVGGELSAFVRYSYGANVTIDLSVSSLEAPSPPVGLTRTSASNDNTPAFTWEAPAEAPGTVASYEVNMDSAVWTDIGYVLTYTHTTSLSDGDHTLQLRAVDKLGTKGEAASLEFMVDTTAPSGPSNLTKTTADNDNTPTFTWEAPAGESAVAYYQVRIDTGDWISIGNVTSYTHTEALSDGDHTFAVRAVDTADNIGDAAELVFTIDIIPPGTPGDLERTSLHYDTTPTFAWTASTDATSGISSYEVRMNGGDWVDIGNVTTFTVDEADALSIGSHIFYVRATDSAGNTGIAASLAFAISDIPLPTTMVITRTTADTNNRPTFTWDLVAGAVTYELKMDNGEWSNIGDVTSYNYTSALTDGSHVVQIRAIGDLGNTLSEGSLIFIIDTVPPTVPGEIVKTTPDYNNTPTFTWVASEDVTSGVVSYEVRMDGGLWMDTGNVALTYTYSTALTDGSHIFGVRAVDAVGHKGEANTLEFTIDATGPEVTVLSPNGGELWAGGTSHYINWSTVDESKGTVDIDYSTNGGTSWNILVSAITDTGSYLWNVPEIDTSQARIRVTATDSAGNSDVDTSDGDFTIDSTPPSIEDVASPEIDTTGAYISWTTGEPATTQVEYGTTAGYGFETGVDAALTLNHAVSLSGLTPGVTYHYRVKSVDAAGNSGVSADRTFTTTPASTTITISDIAVSGITTSSAIITWTTNTPTNSQVEYGLTDTYGLSTVLDTTPTTMHSMSLSGLLSGTIYHYRIKSGAAVSGDGTFTTLVDNDPPVISDVGELVITASNAVITWNTSEPATSKVEYGTASASHDGYEFTSPLNPAMVVYRSIGLAGLSANTTYYYRVISSDAAGNDAVSDEYSFTTLPDSTPPKISGVSSAGIATDSAVISWITSERATSQVTFSQTSYSGNSYASAAEAQAEYGSWTTLDPTLSLGHSAGLGGLTPNTTYYYRAMSADAVGNETVSDEGSFTTLEDKEEPAISDIIIANVSGNSAIIVWNTDEDATTRVVYDTTSHADYTDYASSAPSPADTTADSLGHGVVLSGLVADTTYYYRVVSADAYGNLAVSDEFSFVTEDTTAPAVSLVSAVAKTSTGVVIVWITDENATTQVVYSTTSHAGDTYADAAEARTAYGLYSIEDSSLLESHGVVLTGLTPDTTYYYRVISKDASGNETISQEYSFTTTS